jgi:hypothetical protein
LTGRPLFYNALAVLAVSVLIIASLLYAQITETYDATTLVVSVALPLVLGSVIFSARKERILLFAFLAYFWAVVDDGPVFFDSVLTWPEVTRYHPFLPRLFMNLVIHAFTALFLYLTIREAVRGSRVRLRDTPFVIIFTSVAFVLAYAQNIPLASVQNLVAANWYPFDVAEKLASIFFLYLAVRCAVKLKAKTSRISATNAKLSG